ERCDGVLGLGKATVDPVLQGEQLLGAAALRDLLDDSTITSEAPFAVEHRVAARAEIADRAVRVHATVLVIEERLARIHLRLESGAFRRIDLDSLELPARFPDHRARVEPGLGEGATEEPREAEVLVLLPVPVCGERENALQLFTDLALRARARKLRRAFPAFCVAPPLRRAFLRTHAKYPLSLFFSARARPFDPRLPPRLTPNRPPPA